MADTVEQRVDVRIVVVGRQRHACRAVEVEALHHRLGTVMSCAHRHPEGVEGLRHVVRMHPVEREGDDGIAVLQRGRPEQPRTVDALNRLVVPAGVFIKIKA